MAGRNITYNVLLAYDLLCNYHRSARSADCALKIDLRKSYDSTHWDFVEEVFLGLGCPTRFTDGVMVCIRTCSFSLMINGSMQGYFAGERGFDKVILCPPSLCVVHGVPVLLL